MNSEECHCNKHEGGHGAAPCGEPDRRGFFKKASAVVLGALSVLAPIGAGLAMVIDPLRRKGDGDASRFLRVTTLRSLPDDGVPRKFPVIANRVDAWSKFPATAIGAVYLRREKGKITAYNVLCPHAGCFVDYMAGDNDFLCPCHDSRFALDGKISSANSPSPRGLDSLVVEVRNESEVWVKFQNFRAGVADKVPA
jgi:Rieske Fe-S protein